LQARLAQQRWQAASSGLDDESRKRLLVNQDSVSMVQSQLAGLEAEQLQFAPRAPFSGRLRDMDPDLHVGQWMARKEKIALLVREDADWLIETWLDEESVQRIKVGDAAVFVTDSALSTQVALKVQTIDSDASHVLPRPELAAHLGGHLITREKNGQLVPERAVYRVSLVPQTMPAALRDKSWRGQVTINALSEAPAWRYLRQAFAVLVREIGF
jgi:putative peptide zinc metalloprotease protein